jgi:hypothetical protein
MPVPAQDAGARAAPSCPEPATGNPRSYQAAKPPSSGRTLLIPLRFKSSATLALVASLGQVQNNTISRSRGIKL